MIAARMSTGTPVIRLATLALGVAALVLLPAVQAQAHVHVESDSNVVGSDATLTFRVPSESASARTVKVIVTLPSNPPLLSVSPQVLPGWTADLTEAPLPKPVVQAGTTLTRAPHTVTWTATAGTGIPPEQFAEFGLLIEGLPAAKALTFPTAQYYSDGTVVNWNQPSPPGQPEPDHPVPTLELVAASGAPATSESATPEPTVTVSSAAAPATGSASSSGNSEATWLAIAALVLSVLALTTAVLNRRQSATSAAAPATGSAPR